MISQVVPDVLNHLFLCWFQDWQRNSEIICTKLWLLGVLRVSFIFSWNDPDGSALQLAHKHEMGSWTPQSTKVPLQLS